MDKYAAKKVGDKWRLVILSHLLDGPARFDEMVGTLGIARNILTDRLKGMATDGLIVKTPLKEGGHHSEYSLAKPGETRAAMNAIIGLLRQL